MSRVDRHGAQDVRQATHAGLGTMHSQEDSVSPRIEKNGSGKQDTLSPPSPGAASRSGCWCAVVPPGAGGAGGLLHIAVRELVEGDRLAVLALTSGSKHRQAQARLEERCSPSEQNSNQI